MKKIGVTLTIILSALALTAQKPSLENQKKLLDLAARLRAEYEVEQQELKEYLEIAQGARVDLSALGTPSGFSPTGRLLYTINHNERASIATRTPDLYPGGRLATSITGKGMVLGVWEISSPDVNHPEFEGRLVIKDGGSEVGDHATHVSGTLIAGGVVANARGMAYEATLYAYTASDYLSEIAEAAADGLLVSSHSYGKSAGWSRGEWLGDGNISDTEDWKFGIYNQEAATLDEVAFLAPYYLLIRSAGNERGEDGVGVFPPDGPYDTMTGEAIAKNILAIANAIPQVEVPNHRSQLALRASSSWGPADDGRIKPDLAAPGTNLLSASIDEDGYDFKTGTSMSTPVVSGNAILLQQLHKRLYNHFMKAATLKAVLLHTALDGGSADGPDYEYGYGFLDANFAARAVTERGHLSVIEEKTLNDQATFEIQFEASGDNPLVVSVSWTDPAGEAITDAVLDPTDLALVNDLDVRVTDPEGEVSFPWILNPINPEDAATTGDNFRDNYEKIEIENPISGTYTISVSHKGQLTNDSQDYTLLITNLPRQDEQKAFYWVGESGDWNDPTRWAESSGGSTINEVPTAGDRVIFDVNSFSNSGTVTLNENPSISKLAWFVDNGSKIDFNNNMIEVGQILHLDGPMTELGQILVKPDLALTGSIYLSGENQDLVLQLQKANKDFFLEGEEIALKELELIDGNLTIFNDFSSETLTFSSANLSKIDLSEIEITTSKLNLGDANLNDFSFDNSLIVFGGAENMHEFKSDGLFELETVHLTSGTLTISDKVKIDKANVTAGSTLLIGDQVELEVNDLSLGGTSEDRSMLVSTGTASILSNTSDKFCFDYVDIDGVSVGGSTKFVYESNSTLTDASGWISGQCEDILFSDFSVRSACAKNTTYFEDLSDGNPDSWEWDFGDGTPTSTDQNPTHSYEEPGTYAITLTTIAGSESSTSLREIEIIESLLVKPVVVSQNGSLVAEGPGPSFQWYLDGEPIPGETSRLLSVEIGDGIYQVESFNETCSALSDPFLPLGTSVYDYNFHIYPNPAQEAISFSSDYQQKLLGVAIMDLGGKILDELELTLSSSGGGRIPIERYDSGIYLIRIFNSKEVLATQKIIITK